MEGKTEAESRLLVGEAKKRFDVVAMADEVEGLVGDKEMCDWASTKNVPYAKERFAAPQVVECLEAIYARVVG